MMRVISRIALIFLSGLALGVGTVWAEDPNVVVSTPVSRALLQRAQSTPLPLSAEERATLPHGAGNDMAGGSSGVPWLTEFTGKKKAGNSINGLNSYKYVGRNEAMYGSYFGDGAIEIWNYMTANP